VSGLPVKDVVSTARRSERVNYCARDRRLMQRSIILSLALGARPRSARALICVKAEHPRSERHKFQYRKPWHCRS
jgi:hypothetical protein